jgi:hypothetical protein
MTELTTEEVKDWEKKIDGMSREEMAHMWRFSPSGHPVFRYESPLFKRFKERFANLGGFSPEISKKIGWSP